MRSEAICIEGLGAAGFATITGDPARLEGAFRAWTFLWLTKLVITLEGLSRGPGAEQAPRLKALLVDLTRLDPEPAMRRLMRGRTLILIHRIERAVAAGQWTTAADAALDELEFRLALAHGSLRGSTPRILAIHDYPELAAFRHPEERPSPLSGEAVERELLRAFHQVGRLWPAALAEMRWYVDGVLPMDMPEGRFNSASTDEAPFVAQVTVRPGAWPMLLAESLIHEMSHIKLDIAASLQPLLTAESHQRNFSHPWRPDRRPLIGVLLGAHAFLAVMMLYRRAVDANVDADRSLTEFRTRRDEVGLALEVLVGNLGLFTPFGLEILADMRDAYRVTAAL